MLLGEDTTLSRGKEKKGERRRLPETESSIFTEERRRSEDIGIIILAQMVQKAESYIEE